MNKFNKTRIIGWLVCLLGALFYGYEYLLRITPNVMIPELMHQFHVTAGGLGLIISMYYFAYTPLQLVVGAMTDYFGPRKILSLALLCCVVGSLTFEASHLPFIGGFGRFLIGVGSAFAFVGALKLASIWLPANRFALFVGLTNSLGMVGAISGDIGLSVLEGKLGWQQTLTFSSLLGLMLLPFIFFGIRRNKNATPTVIKAHPINARALYLEVFYMLKKPQMWLAGLVGCMLYLSLSAFAESWGIAYLQVSYHLSRSQATISNTMIFWGWLIGSPIAGWLSDYWRSRRLPLMLGAFAAAIIFAVILWVPVPLWALRTLLFIFGFFCSAEIICFAIGRDLNKNVYAATAVSFINMVVMISGMVFQPLIGKLLETGGHTVIRGGMVYPAHAYRLAFAAIPIALLLACVMIYFLKESHGREVHCGFDF